MARSALLQTLREERADLDRERSVDEAVAVALRLGAQAVRDYARAHGCSRDRARQALRAERQRGRRPSACLAP